ncbi:MAG: helix-turn-helix domain-containing protein [Gemmatimonadaceae bacterium]|nr:helix-turn-helix domain-containing protein [Gemmatimonadaceae bacterium]
MIARRKGVDGGGSVRAGWSESDRQLLALFGARVRRFRKEKGYSIAVLAGQADLDASYLGELERGRKNVSLVTAARIAAALAVPVSVLLTPETRQPPGQ